MFRLSNGISSISTIDSNKVRKIDLIIQLTEKNKLVHFY